MPSVSCVRRKRRRPSKAVFGFRKASAPPSAGVLLCAGVVVFPPDHEKNTPCGVFFRFLGAFNYAAASGAKLGM